MFFSGSILQHEKQLKLRQTHAKVNARAQELLANYKIRVQKQSSAKTLLEMALELDFSPISLSRIILTVAYADHPKSNITEMVRNFDLIPDPMLSLNVQYCVFNDNQEGSIADAARRCIGEEYELYLKELARKSGMVFYDEGDLRREGYDKTPDMKMAIPFSYKNKVVHWIESKALFGDHESHKKYLNDQLLSYINRFGCGIVIYWFGFIDEIRDYPENDDHIIILDSFPSPSDMNFLNFDETPSDVNNIKNSHNKDN